MIEKRQKWTVADCNIPGVLAGIGLMALPFLGYWWSVRFGNGAFMLEVSPFMLGMYGFGQEFFSPLIAAVNTAIIIIIVFYGALLLVGSVFRCSRQYRQLSDQLVGIGAKKPIWLVLFFMVTIVITGFGIEYSLQETGIEISMPMIMGDTVGTITTFGTTVQIPVSLSLNSAFWYALVFGIIAASAGIYQKRRYYGESEDNTAEIPAGDAPTTPEGEKQL
ncbi:hypothetical protein [Methanogenium organophilum]|uniref:Uncharacterized protein n=1 Tax=Methanogenium organophilum TaxID=2199 RepID=A0A9X9T9X2_METOG|nr:hypothetical protein [Methanogenium organophilum]WAI02517.1 hypothetical protein OU421_06475 [Methanogenium organophilum]